MDTGRISTRYAKAIFEIAISNHSETVVYEEMTTLANSFLLIPKLKKTIKNPQLKENQIKSLLLTATGNDINPVCNDFNKFLDVVISHRRENYLQTICLVYQDIYRKAKNIVIGKLTTAFEPTEDTIQKIKELVAKISNLPEEGKVEFETIINPQLIGGFQLQIGSKLLDASISSEIRDIKKDMENKVLASK